MRSIHRFLLFNINLPTSGCISVVVRRAVVFGRINLGEEVLASEDILNKSRGSLRVMIMKPFTSGMWRVALQSGC